VATPSKGAAYDLLESTFKGPLDYRETVVSAGVSALPLVGANPDRVSLTICNLGAADIFLTTYSSPTSSRGIRLSGGGGALSMNCPDDGILPALAWNVISSGAANAVYILECFRYIDAGVFGVTP